MESQRNLTHDLIIPTAFFTALGAMSWAVRGCSGFGGSDGCLFAGVLWGAGWWFIARDPNGTQSRRYTSGWIILAVAFGFYLAGGRGWAQWSTFFEGRLQTNTATNEFVPISPAYGFLWLFIAGVPWAGIGACMLAWCGSKRFTPPWLWGVRIACGVAGFYIAGYAFEHLPQLFLPLYSQFQDKYNDLAANHNLKRLINDNRAAIHHMGIYLGFLAFEIGRRDWKNVTLILTVGLISGFGWSICQNWTWADDVFPNIAFNWWRCWESSGGISIGIAYGVAYYLVNRPVTEKERADLGLELTNVRPNLERLGAYLGLILGLGLSVRNGLKGWANIYLGNEDYWSRVFWWIIGPIVLIMLVAIIVRILVRRLPKGYPGDVFPHAYALMWTVLIIQNILAQLVTGPPTQWSERAFNIYYLILFALTGLIVFRVRRHKRVQPT